MSPRKTYILKLYVAGNTPNSMRALKTLRNILETEFRGVYALKVIDVLKNPQLAEEDKILATPTLAKILPPPVRRIIGDLSDRERVLIGLDLLYDELSDNMLTSSFLDDSDEESGCLQVIPGSHRWGSLPPVDFGGDLEQVKEHLTDSQLVAFQPNSLPLRAGEASIHHSSTLHGSLANRSERPRRAIVLNFMAPDTRCADESAPLLSGVPLLKVGALIEGEHFPIVLDREST